MAETLELHAAAVAPGPEERATLLAEERQVAPTLWLLSFVGAISMVVASFIPWLAVDPVVAEARGWFGADADGVLQVLGINTSYGLASAALGALAALALLVQRNLLAMAASIAAVGLAAWLHFMWVPSLGASATTLAGLWVFKAACVVSAVTALAGARRATRAERRRLIRRWVDRKLNPGDQDSKLVDTFIITLIAVNVLSVIVETEQAIADANATFFLVNETVSTLIFTVEYVLRVWVSDLTPRFLGRGMKGRFRYALSMMALVDFIAIAPFFLQFIEMDLRIARAIRLMRLVRILKMGRYAHAVRTLGNVIGRKKEELAISTFVAAMVLILVSSAMYFTEHSAQPEAFRSIPETMWWAIVTLTSVGYGDVSPVTGLGKVVGAVVCMLGVLLVALPTGILASGFLEEMREQRRGKDAEVFGFCPHCGKQLIPGEELD